MQITVETVAELGAGHIPMLMVYNKADLCAGRKMEKEQDAEHTENLSMVPRKGYPRKKVPARYGSGHICGGVYISAKEEDSIDLLVNEILEQVYGDYMIAEFLIPYDKGNLTAFLMEHTQVIAQDYRENGTYIKASCHRADVGKLSFYTI